MKTLLYFLLFLTIAMIAIVIGVIIGDYASWYFAWIVGTAMIVLISAASGAFFDAQEDDRRNDGTARGGH
jgi:predicted lysophospholipase L1 biosynthesis ABC-type transport system permease subunit